MAALVDLMPVYGGVLPNKDEQTATVFDGAADTWITYEYGTYVPAFNLVAGQLNTLSTQVELYKNQSSVFAGTASTQAANSSNSAIAAANAAVSVNTAQAQVNAQLGLGIGGSYVDANGHLQMTYDDGVITSISLDANGHFILEY